MGNAKIYRLFFYTLVGVLYSLHARTQGAMIAPSGAWQAAAAVNGQNINQMQSNTQTQIQAMKQQATANPSAVPGLSEVSACEQAIEAARIACDPDRDGSYINATQQAGKAAAMISQMSGQNPACSKFGQAITAVHGALSGFQYNC